MQEKKTKQKPLWKEHEEEHEEAICSATVEDRSGLFCPNCGARLEGRKCKLLCPRPGCGYMVTCSEW